MNGQNVNTNRVSCQFCFFDHTDPKRVILHMLNKHNKDVTFTVKCVVKDCMYSTKNWAGYRQHFKCKHNLNFKDINWRNVLSPDFNHVDKHEDDREMNCDRNDDDGHFQDNMLTGKFVLSLEAGHKVSTTAVDSIVSSTGSLISDLLQNLSRRVLSIPGIHAFQENIQDVFWEHNSFVDLNDLTSHQHRWTFYRDNFMLVTPEKTLLGSKYVHHNGERQRKLVIKFGCFIPLLKMVEMLIELPQIQRFIQKDHMSSSEIMKDVCDGHYIKSHELKDGSEIFLQFVMSYDDLELQNPLRSNKTHKLGMFYFTLLNIPPQYRSQLQNIFLLTVAKTKDLKHFGLDQILHDFLPSLKLLRDEGVFMVINGERIHVRGDLIFSVCDTPAAAFLGGFKESSFAFKSCRMCTMTGQMMKDNFFPQNFDIRDWATYEQQCDVLNDPALRRNRGYWSKMYGISKKSVLCELTQFPVTQNILQDPMHCLLEGVCGQEIALFLNRIIYDLGLVSLNWFNDRLQHL